MIKAVLFDYGGVLSEAGKAGGIQETIANLCGRRPEDVVIPADLHQKFLRGEVTEGEYFGQVNRLYPCAAPITANSFIAGSNIYVRSKPVYELAAKLRSKGIKTGVLSNMYPMSAAKLRDEGYYDDFDPVVVSSSEHLAKPNPAFFQLALDRLGLPGSEVLFIDDQERFRAPAEGLGMRFIVAATPQQIVDDVTALIKKENNLTLE